MPPLPVIAGQARITVNFSTYGGVTPRCVFHIGTALVDEEEISNLVWNSFPEGLYGPMHQSFEPGSIDVLRLDGTSATFIGLRPPAIDTDLCLSEGQILPMAACLVSLRTVIRGPRGRGRQYVGPITETSITEGNMEPTVRANLQTAWLDFVTNLGAEPTPGGLFVTSYAHATAQLVTNISVRQAAAVQRRRQNQLVG